MEYSYLERKIDKTLLAWKQEEHRLPIVLNGARQVGKTEAVRHFARACYTNFIEVNFVEQPEYKGILLDGFSADAIVKRMSLVNPSLKFIPGESALLHEQLTSPDAWLRILREGGTRTFEGWGRDTKWNTSLFHLTAASVVIFLCDSKIERTVGRCLGQEML